MSVPARLAALMFCCVCLSIQTKSYLFSFRDELSLSSKCYSGFATLADSYPYPSLFAVAAAVDDNIYSRSTDCPKCFASEMRCKANECMSASFHRACLYDFLSANYPCIFSATQLTISALFNRSRRPNNCS